jgi:hypothetical protein
MMTSATLLIHPQSGSDWFLAAPLAGQAAAGYALLRAPPLFLIIARIVRFAAAPERSLASSNQFLPSKSRNLYIFSIPAPVLNPPTTHL